MKTVSTLDWDTMTVQERRDYLKDTSLAKYAATEELIKKQWHELSYLEQWSIVIARSHKR